jgi:hypothetical protein
MREEQTTMKTETDSDRTLVDAVVSQRCCGRDIETPFCPYCGSEVAGHTLYTLLSHCKAALAQSERELKNAASRQNERQMGLKSKPVRKWSAWVKALEEVLTSKSG